jgi:ABC-type dipeptide/oligopeptide/nickel transport system permease component
MWPAWGLWSTRQALIAIIRSNGGYYVLALSMLAANLFADIAYAFADPRIRYD